jgi:hypothetical protein
MHFASRILVLISCAACCGAFQSSSSIWSAPSALSSRCAAVHRRGQQACLSPMTMAARDVDCLVIGGGISGLTTAFYADKVLIEFPSQPQFVLFSRTTRTIALRWR